MVIIHIRLLSLPNIRIIYLPHIYVQVVPGDNANLEIELIAPLVMSEGLRFALREGGKTVGAGVVTKVIE